MPRRSILSSAERDGPLVMPDNPGALIRLYMFSDADLAVIRQRRGGSVARRCFASLRLRGRDSDGVRWLVRVAGAIHVVVSQLERPRCAPTKGLLAKRIRVKRFL